MVKDGVAVDAKLAAAVAAFVNGEEFKVAARCRELGVSRPTFYKYVDRFAAEGVDGFYPRSRRPSTSPGMLAEHLADVLVAIRKQEADQGWDYGADAVRLRLREQPHLWPADQPLPSRATINRVFEDRGQLAKVPQRRPRAAYRRFVRSKVNELWQYDGFQVPYRLGDHTRPVVLQIIDDCSRLDVALQVARNENGPEIWSAFTRGVDRYGLPAAVLTDNGASFSGRRRGWTSDFEANLFALSIKSITCRIGHPQTCGKTERGHQRVLKWLRRQPVAADAAGLQTQLDAYRDRYNQRGSSVHDGLSPQQRFDLGPLDGPEPAGLELTTFVTQHRVSSHGAVAVDNALIGIGYRYATATATAIRTGDDIAIFIGHHFVRRLVINRNHRYQRRDDLR